MSKTMLAVLTAAVLAVASPAGAQQAIATPTIQQETTLVLRGEGKVELKPDFATINTGVSIERRTAKDAMQEQAKKMNAIVPALKTAGIAERDIRTSRLSLNPAYTYPRDGQQELRGYIAANVVTVKVRNLDKMGEILDTLVTAGSNTISSISFGVENDDEPRRQARAGAVKDAMSKAQDYATAMGLKVKRIVNLSEPGIQATPMTYDRVVVTGSRLGSAPPTPIEVGEISIKQLVDITFELAK